MHELQLVLIRIRLPNTRVALYALVLHDFAEDLSLDCFPVAASLLIYLN